MAIDDLRSFLKKLDQRKDLKIIGGGEPKFEIGAIAELSFQHRGPALLFDKIREYQPGYRVAVNVTSTRERSLMAIGMDPELPEGEAMKRWKKQWDNFKPIPPVIVKAAAFMENVETDDRVDLLQFPVPVWHELDGGPYIGTGLAVILKDPDEGWVNLGSYRLLRHDRATTGLFCEPENDGMHIIEKFWKQGKSCPVAVSLGPEPLIFLTASGSTGCPPRIPEYDYAGFVIGEPIEVVEGPVTGLPISTGSEIVIEGEIPPPGVESRPEGPFGEWTGYYMASSVPEPVIRVQALYYRSDPILYGAPPFKPFRESYAFSLPMRSVTGLWSRLDKLGLPVRRVTDLVKMGATVVSIHQEKKDDVDRVMDALDKMRGPGRLFMVVDDDVNPDDAIEVLWAVGTRFDPEAGVRVSIAESRWLLDPLRKIEDRKSRSALPYKRLIINGCRPFDHKEFPPVNRFSPLRREQTWSKWKMGDWLSSGNGVKDAD